MKQLFLIIILFNFNFLSAKEKIDPPQVSFKVLEEEEVFQKTEYSVGSKVSMDEDGNLINVILGQDQEILNKTGKDSPFPHTIPKGSIVIYSPKKKGDFLPEKISFSETTTIHNVKILKRSIIFVTGGEFKNKDNKDIVVEFTYKLRQPQKINGVALPKGTKLYVNKNGDVKKAVKNKWVALDYEEE
ncbi:MAG: hypothetical protein KDK36_17460 [Leptospiraceae bacterium]|nr:hypothetical protein [Leptospiraceae bacterium]